MAKSYIWPPLEAFSHIVNAWVYIPVNETYSYHGNKLPCKKAPSPPPFITEPLILVGEKLLFTVHLSLAYWNECRMFEYTYYKAWNKLTAIIDAAMSPYIMQGYFHHTEKPEWYMRRILLYFPTQSLPGDAEIESVVLKVYVYSKRADSERDFSIVVQSGMPEIPHYPYQETDAWQGWYSGNYGSIKYSDVVVGEYLLIPLDTSLITVIDYTKIMLRHSDDIAAEPPKQFYPPRSSRDFVRIACYYHRPELIIKYWSTPE